MNVRYLKAIVPLVLVCYLCLAFAGLARGQTSVAPPSASSVSATTSRGVSGDLSALRVTFRSVDEERDSQGRSTILLDLTVVGEGLSPKSVLKKVTVTKAVDNLGNVVGPRTMTFRSAATSSVSQSDTFPNMASGRSGSSPLIVHAALDTSVRKAESLQYVEGTIELYLPSEANGSVIRIPNVLSHAGLIEDSALAKQGIEFHFLPDQASYDEAKAQVAGFQVRATPPNFPNGVGYSYRDPFDRLASHELQDVTGSAIPTKGSSYSGANGTSTGAIRLMVPLPAAAQLVIFLKLPEAVRTVPFRVENIVLP